MSSANSKKMTTTPGSLLQELKKKWDEIVKMSDSERQSDSEGLKMLLQTEQECLEVYMKKIKRTVMDEAESEVDNLSALGKASLSRKLKRTRKEQISAEKPVSGDLRLKKERIKNFQNVQSQIVHLLTELACNAHPNSADPQIIEQDVAQDATKMKLGELNSHLQELQREKSVRIQRSEGLIRSINEMVNKFDPSLIPSPSGQLNSISNDALARLAGYFHSLKQKAHKRLQKLQDLGHRLIKLSDLMDTPEDLQNRYGHVTHLISATLDEVPSSALTLDVINWAELEVKQLKDVKSNPSKMKELLLKKKNVLEEICEAAYMDVDTVAQSQISIISLIDEGVDLLDLVSKMNDQIKKAKKHALGRKDIWEIMEKLKVAMEEETWLDVYARDQNCAEGRAHENLERVEKARMLVSEIPSLVENLTTKVDAWEWKNELPFKYDKIPLLESLREYVVNWQKREKEKQRSKGKKLLPEQHAVEQETRYGSKPSPVRLKKPLGQINSNTADGTPTGRHSRTSLSRHGISASKEWKESGKAAESIPPSNFMKTTLQQNNEAEEDFWNRPEENWIRINTDGSGGGGYSAIARDHNGDPIKAVYPKSEQPVTAFFHEMEGILAGLALARSLRESNFIITTDCERAFQIIDQNQDLSENEKELRKLPQDGVEGSNYILPIGACPLPILAAVLFGSLDDGGVWTTEGITELKFNRCYTFIIGFTE
ncbi:Microtubule-associated protein [Macleaya cordata]|uniref:Microtubule-associated protein n=1 Tax=Macleaya cordata TaxID=56857 RepID=A0A200R6A5_MACCD|nr:Microtubule-associated protein [Macleaya cordata]